MLAWRFGWLIVSLSAICAAFGAASDGINDSPQKTVRLGILVGLAIVAAVIGGWDWPKP